MKRLVLAALLLAAANAFAADDFRLPTAEELELKEVAWAPGAPAVILDWWVKHDDDASYATEYVRIKVLTEEGKKYGDIELLSIPRYHSVKRIEARTMNPGKAPIAFNGTVYDKLVVKGGGVKVLQKTFTLPDVQPGSILEYRHIVNWPSRKLRTNRWILQREIPILVANFEIRPARGFGSLCTVRGLPPDVKVQRAENRYTLTIEKVAAFTKEPFSLPDAELKPRLEFFYTQTDAANYWVDISKLAGELIEDFIGNRKGVKQAAMEITADAADDETKLRRLYKHVQTLRNLTYEREKTAAEEKREKLRERDHIEDVLRYGYGERGELNRLFVGLARAAGFEANIAAVSRRDEVLFSRALSDISQFDAELAVVRVNGSERFYDPGTPYVRPGLLPWQNTIVPALFLKPEASGSWHNAPDQGYAMAVTNRAADLRLDEESLKGTVTVTYRGQEALVKRLAAHGEDEPAYRKLFEDELKALLPSGSLLKMTDVQYLTGTDEPLIVRFDVEVPGVISATASRLLAPLALFGSSAGHPFASETRLHTVHFPYQRQLEETVSLTLPEGYAVESLPKPVTSDVGGLAYSIVWQQQAGKVTVARRLTYRTIAIPPAEYKTLRNFFGEALTADQQPAVLRK